MTETHHIGDNIFNTFPEEVDDDTAAFLADVEAAYAEIELEGITSDYVPEEPGADTVIKVSSNEHDSESVHAWLPPDRGSLLPHGYNAAEDMPPQTDSSGGGGGIILPPTPPGGGDFFDWEDRPDTEGHDDSGHDATRIIGMEYRAAASGTDTTAVMPAYHEEQTVDPEVPVNPTIDTAEFPWFPVADRGLADQLGVEESPAVIFNQLAASTRLTPVPDAMQLEGITPAPTAFGEHEAPTIPAEPNLPAHTLQEDHEVSDAAADAFAGANAYVVEAVQAGNQLTFELAINDSTGAAYNLPADAAETTVIPVIAPGVSELPVHSQDLEQNTALASLFSSVEVDDATLERIAKALRNMA